MDWQGAPEGAESLSVSVWHELVDVTQHGATAELPVNDEKLSPGNVVFLWQKAPGAAPEIVEFTQRVSSQTP